MPSVSIIVPIYNMEKYLVRCLDSIVNQELQDLEIICVNDGSNDSSRRILEEYSARDKRITLIHKENEGVSAARNTGIEASTGEYIGFVDPDDWIEPYMYSQLFKAAVKENSDIVMCSYIREFGTHSKAKELNLPEKLTNDQIGELIRKLIGPIKNEVANPELLDAWGTVWSKIYRRSLLKENEIRFIDLKEIGTNEDTLFNLYSFSHANAAYFINYPFYHYWRANNQSVTSYYKEDLLEQWLNLFRLFEKFISENELSPAYISALRNRICLGTLGLGLNIISQDNKLLNYKKLKEIKNILNNDQIKKAFKEFDLTYLPIHWRVFYSLGKFRMTIGFYFMLVSIETLRRNIK
ncbi:glycosyltransferase [Metabacillus sp. GX 13764]|uniref:glycosyltransferase n=1 Tax=Metabacillus kandeliae TaxID=2900151 RepID=UPI001E3B1119|nr:glycosyltransferase [Metabacillus kandeliae]MCD7033138.1 glycosyltransferase [Metabacillus kandeliae]